MKILKQEKKGNQVVLEIEEDFKQLDPHIKKAYAEASSGLKIPGFRQGKVPADMMKQYINEEVVVDRAVQLLISEEYPEIIAQSKIRPVDYPNVEVKKLAKSGPIVFEVKIDVYPEIKLGTYKGIKLKKMDTSVSEEEVTKTIDFLRTEYAKQNNIAVSEVAVDDDFAKKISTTKTLEELKTLITSNIEIEKKNDAEAAVRDDATRKLADLVEADLPAGMIEREIEVMLNDLETSLKRNRMTIDAYLAVMKKDMIKLKEELKPNAVVRIKAKLALEKIAEKEKLAVDDSEMDKEIEVLAEHTGKTLEEYRAEISAEVKESMKEYMLNEKAMNFVIEKAKEE